MLGLVHRILRFSGSYARHIRLAYLFTFLRAFCINMPLMLAVYALNIFLSDEATALTLFLLAAGMVVLFVV